MKKMLMTLFTRTPLHVGAGNSVGAVDSPIQRERHTRIPIIPGSSLKGVLADLWNDEDNCKTNDKGQWIRNKGSEAEKLFGATPDTKEDSASAGKLLIGEARVLAFPVRSAKGMFAWVTCPLALKRFQRETGKAFSIPELGEMEAHSNDTVIFKGNGNGKGEVILEEYVCAVTDKLSDDVVKAFEPLVNNDPVWDEISKRLVIISDELFQHFCEHACEVVTRIKVDDEKGTVVSGALFNQEQAPSETLFYTVLFESETGLLETFKNKLKSVQHIQIGGDATIGLGFCTVTCGEAEQ